MDKEILSAIIKLSRYVIAISLLFCIVILATILNAFLGHTPSEKKAAVPAVNVATSSGTVAAIDTKPVKVEEAVWMAPDTRTIPNTTEGTQIKYGRALVANTSKYFGPKGSVAHISNNMNCQNCHNEAGTKPYALNYSAVASTYPQFKARSNTWVSIAMRINGCFQRSMNGKPLDSTTHEMKAMIAYMKWLGKGVDKGVKPAGGGVEKLAFLDRAADPLKVKAVFLNNCQSCHGKSGEGLLSVDGNGYTYPPLWGKNSYNDGAGLYRITTFAGFAKNNMPFGTNYQHPILTDEEAWDVAAYVNSQPRPHKDQSKDWKNIAQKPIDFPFGPYADQFSEKQHKLGPFKPIKAAQKSK